MVGLDTFTNLISLVQGAKSGADWVSHHLFKFDADTAYTNAVKEVVLHEKNPYLREARGYELTFVRERYAERLKGVGIRLQYESIFASRLDDAIKHRAAEQLLAQDVLIGFDPAELDMDWAKAVIASAHMKYERAIKGEAPDRVMLWAIETLSQVISDLAGQMERADRGSQERDRELLSLVARGFDRLNSPRIRHDARDLPRPVELIPTRQSLVDRLLSDIQTGIAKTQKFYVLEGERRIGKTEIANTIAWTFYERGLEGLEGLAPFQAVINYRCADLDAPGKHTSTELAKLLDAIIRKTRPDDLEPGSRDHYLEVATMLWARLKGQRLLLVLNDVSGTPLTHSANGDRVTEALLEFVKQFPSHHRVLVTTSSPTVAARLGVTPYIIRGFSHPDETPAVQQWLKPSPDYDTAGHLIRELDGRPSDIQRVWDRCQKEFGGDVSSALDAFKTDPLRLDGHNLDRSVVVQVLKALYALTVPVPQAPGDRDPGRYPDLVYFRTDAIRSMLTVDAAATDTAETSIGHLLDDLVHDRLVTQVRAGSAPPRYSLVSDTQIRRNIEALWTTPTDRETDVQAMRRRLADHYVAKRDRKSDRSIDWTVFSDYNSKIFGRDSAEDEFEIDSVVTVARDLIDAIVDVPSLDRAEQFVDAYRTLFFATSRWDARIDFCDALVNRARDLSQWHVVARHKRLLAWVHCFRSSRGRYDLAEHYAREALGLSVAGPMVDRHLSIDAFSNRLLVYAQTHHKALQALGLIAFRRGTEKATQLRQELHRDQPRANSDMRADWEKAHDYFEQARACYRLARESVVVPYEPETWIIDFHIAEVDYQDREHFAQGPTETQGASRELHLQKCMAAFRAILTGHSLEKKEIHRRLTGNCHYYLGKIHRRLGDYMAATQDLQDALGFAGTWDRPLKARSLFAQAQLAKDMSVADGSQKNRARECAAEALVLFEGLQWSLETNDVEFFLSRLDRAG
jgi:hypothetical protein